MEVVIGVLSSILPAQVIEVANDRIAAIAQSKETVLLLLTCIVSVWWGIGMAAAIIYLFR